MLQYIFAWVSKTNVSAVFLQLIIFTAPYSYNFKHHFILRNDINLAFWRFKVYLKCTQKKRILLLVFLIDLILVAETRLKISTRTILMYMDSFFLYYSDFITVLVFTIQACLVWRPLVYQYGQHLTQCKYLGLD